MHRVLKIGRKWLYEIHRWIGIACCLLFVVWFVSGLVMMYVPYPSVTEAERLKGAAPIDWTQVRLGPTEAMAAAGVTAFPTRLRLESWLGEPVYRLVDAPRRLTVSARDGRLVGGADTRVAARVAAAFGRAPAARVETIERDQWTVAGGFDPHRPLHRVALSDPAGTTLYVSSATGEVVQAATRAERFWNWLGSVPHWIYLTSIRQDQPLWRQVILWTSGVGMVSAVTGIWIGLLRLRIRRRFHHGKMTPYRGWMKWHHVGGLATGLTLTTWVFSGWLSVNPFEWFGRNSVDPAAVERYAGAPGARFDVDLAQLSAAAPEAREVSFTWAAGRPIAVAARAPNDRVVLDGAAGGRAAFDDAALVERARLLMPGVAVAERTRVTQEDVYWYGHHGEVRLPVLRVKFADPAGTWFHIDPATGEMVGALNANGRAERWLFNFLHDFDLPVLMNHRPVWDLLLWALSIGGLVISVTSVVIAWRRLKRKGQELRAWTRRVGRRRPRLDLPIAGE